MPGSITSVPPSPPILTYVLSVGGLVSSLMFTAFGFTNNAWIVLYRPAYMDEFQRGIRGHDCYKINHEQEGKNIKCLPWEFEDKSSKFPVPFNQSLDASIIIYIAGFIAKMIMISQIFWLGYSIAHCCSQRFSDKADKFKIILFHIMVIAVGMWLILFGLIFYEAFTDKIIPPQMKKDEYEYQIGKGCWLFFLGGLLPFTISVYCLFGEQMNASKERLRAIIQRRQQVPTHEEEMMPRA